MATVPFFAQAAMTTTSVTAYTVPQSRWAVIKSIVIANTNVGSTLATVQAVASGGTAGNSSTVVPAYAVPGNTAFQDLYFLPLDEGGRIVTIANSTGLTLTVGGVEVTK